MAQRVIVVHQPWYINQSIRIPSAAGPRSATRLSVRMDLHLTTFFLGSIRKNSCKSVPPNNGGRMSSRRPGQPSYGACEGCHGCGDDLILPPSPVAQLTCCSICSLSCTMTSNKALPMRPSGVCGKVSRLTALSVLRPWLIDCGVEEYIGTF
jgi:hypothetical protein